MDGTSLSLCFSKIIPGGMHFAVLSHSREKQTPVSLHLVEMRLLPGSGLQSASAVRQGLQDIPSVFMHGCPGCTVKMDSLLLVIDIRFYTSVPTEECSCKDDNTRVLPSC